MPMPTISWAGTWSMRFPSRTISPRREGGTSPEMERMVVLLPAPFEPMRVTISPWSIYMETPFRA
jgi:hypothetical protein